VDFVLHHGDNATSSLEPWAYPHRAEAIPVFMTTLDRLCADRSRLHLVKIDAEGAEALEAESGATERTKGKRRWSGKRRSYWEPQLDVIHCQASGNRQLSCRTGTARGLAHCYPYMFRQSATSATSATYHAPYRSRCGTGGHGAAIRRAVASMLASDCLPFLG
jgi:hypothetical protein